MNGVTHISEEAAGQNFQALLDRALAGERIVVRRNGEDVAEIGPVRQRDAKGRMPLRTLGEIIAGLRLREQTDGLARPDESFAQDLADIREKLNASFEAGQRE